MLWGRPCQASSWRICAVSASGYAQRLAQFANVEVVSHGKKQRLVLRPVCRMPTVVIIMTLRNVFRKSAAIATCTNLPPPCKRKTFDRRTVAA